MPSLRPVALLLLVLLPTACDGLSAENSGPRIPDTCVVKADEPHKSTTSRFEEIVGKGWFNCSMALQDAELEVEVHRRSGGDWQVYARTDRDWQSPTVRKKYLLSAPGPCSTGTFRTAARLSIHDRDGVYSRSQWYFSKVRSDPCKE